MTRAMKSNLSLEIPAQLLLELTWLTKYYFEEIIEISLFKPYLHWLP